MEIISKYRLDLRYLLDNESHLEYVGDIGADGKLHGHGTIKNENITKSDEDNSTDFTDVKFEDI